MEDVPDFEVPGVRVESVDLAGRSIEAVETSTTAFVGDASRGPAEPVEVRSLVEYERAFGPRDPRHELGRAVEAFFRNGGRRAWVVRVPPAGSAPGVLAGLPALKDVGLLCLPGERRLEVLRQALGVAARRRWFLIVDAMDREPRDAARLARALGDAPTARNAALYWPPLRVTDGAGAERLGAPSGAIAGLFARVDVERGVWTAPAGERGTLVADGLAVDAPASELGPLADAGVNAIRAFEDGAVRVWGARTLAPADPEWKYVNVRRLLLFLERSIERGLRWAVFEPNDEPLWREVARSVERFLVDLWRAGAFVGQVADEAYLVRCDRTTMTQEDIDAGRLNVLVGVAPLRPAEFVVIDIRKNLAARR